MKFYIRIIPPNGRRGFTELAENLNTLGIVTAEYHTGGWNDYLNERTYPHLRFLDEQEAIVYALKFGGTIEREFPCVEITQ